MFWSGNYIAVRELNSLLKEENVTLSQVLEADDILQECKADNKELMAFLTRPDILSELITLITEEPPKNVELSQQYRHTNIACEVLTSHLSMLSDRLSSDTVQMNRLCDFINKDPPLNPLLASYFSKTVEMLLERNPKQDCYLYHIVCLRVLDFFKSRRDFLPNLLRHISTSAIADVFKYFIRLDDLFNKIVMEWLDEHQFIECLINIVCGCYLPEEFPATQPEPEKGQRETSEKADLNHNDDAGNIQQDNEEKKAQEQVLRVAAGRRARVAADNAAALLLDLVATGCAPDGCETRSRCAASLCARLGCARGVALLLGAAFTSPPRARAAAAAHAAALLRALHDHREGGAPAPAAGAGGAPAAWRSGVELGVAPHLPLLHHALLHPPHQEGVSQGVGWARVQIAALIAQLALSDVHEVATTLLTLGTPGVLVDLLVQYPDNNFLHSAVLAMIRNALDNPAYRTQYATHLCVECDIVTRLLDLYEENNNKALGARRGHAGHVTLALVRLADDDVAGAAGAGAGAAGAEGARAQRWNKFREETLPTILHYLDTPLGGTHPADCDYEGDNIIDTIAANYDYADMAATAAGGEGGDAGDEGDGEGEGEGVADPHADTADMIASMLHLRGDDSPQAKADFLELASRRFPDDMWEDEPEPCAADDEPWPAHNPAPPTDDWARFDAFPGAAHDPFAPAAPPPPPFWSYEEAGEGTGEGAGEAEARLRALRLAEQESLASNLLTAMSAMTPAALARLVAQDLPATLLDDTAAPAPPAAPTPAPAAPTPASAHEAPAPADS